MKTTKAIIATMIQLCWPLFAVIIGWLVLKEPLNLVQIIAAIVLSLDIVILSFSQQAYAKA